MKDICRKFLVAVILLGLVSEGYAQCTECESKLAYVADFCFTDSKFAGLCVQFSETQPNFLIQNGKKGKYIPSVNKATEEYLISLAADSKLKLSALEILFLQKALSGWEIERRNFGYTYRDSGLGVKMLDGGTGDLPNVGDRVTVHYTGYLEDGTKFDSSVDRGKPFSFVLGAGQVIKGWDEGIGLLKKGSRAYIRVPANLGYGSMARGQIPANATLVFEVELIE